MKLSDLLIRNPQLILMLPRFDIGLGFGDKRVVDICKKHNVNFHPLECLFKSYLIGHTADSFGIRYD